MVIIRSIETSKASELCVWFCERYLCDFVELTRIGSFLVDRCLSYFRGWWLQRRLGCWLGQPRQRRTKVQNRWRISFWWVFFWFSVISSLAEELIECDTNGYVSTALYTKVLRAIIKRVLGVRWMMLHHLYRHVYASMCARMDGWMNKRMRVREKEREGEREHNGDVWWLLQYGSHLAFYFFQAASI